jgi:hypothetical protein
MGLSPEYFWSLTWYDWGLFILKLHKENQRRKSEREFQTELTRGFMALVANTNRDPKKHPMPFLPEDFYKLSYDVQTTQEQDPDLFRKLKQKFGSTIKGDIKLRKKKKGSGNE